MRDDKNPYVDFEAGLDDPNQLNNDPDIDNINDDIEIESRNSYLSSTPRKNIVVFGILIISAIIFLYVTVFKDDPAQKEKKANEALIKSQPVEAAIEPVKPIEKLPLDVGLVETPELPAIQPPPPPSALEQENSPLSGDQFGGFAPEQKPAAPSVPPLLPITQPPAQAIMQPPQVAATPEQPGTLAPQPVIIGPSPEELAARAAARRKSSMLAINGSGGASGREDSSFGNNAPTTLAKTAATQVVATNIGNLSLMIAQGKMLDAILETAINTDLSGALRAIVSRDIYAESGNAILIPRGSRLIGEYTNAAEPGQERVVVKWNRVIRPDGVDVQITSPGTDQLGRAGVAGIVDNKYLEIIGNSLLLSSITIGGTIAIDALHPSKNTSSTNTTSANGDVSSSSSGSPTDFAVMQGASDIGDTAAKIAEGLLNDKPTIIVQQGTRIKVFVNKDLIFPQAASGQIKVLN